MSKILTLQEIRKMAVGKKIKNVQKLSKEELAKALNLDEEVYKRPSNAREVSSKVRPFGPNGGS